jgi:hypothetical protein
LRRLYLNALAIDLNVSQPRLNELEGLFGQGITYCDAVWCDRKRANQLPISLAGLVKHESSTSTVRQEHDIRFMVTGQID